MMEVSDSIGYFAKVNIKMFYELPCAYKVMIRCAAKNGASQTHSWLRSGYRGYPLLGFLHCFLTFAKLHFMQEVPMRDIYEVLRRKQAEQAQLGKQIEALQHAAEQLRGVAHLLNEEAEGTNPAPSI
jgi:hypothetical protein